MKIIEAMNESYSDVTAIRNLRSQLKDRLEKLKADAGSKPVVDAMERVDKKAADLVAVEQSFPAVGIVSLASLNAALGSLLVSVESSDNVPTAQATNAFASYQSLLAEQRVKWNALKMQDIPALNSLLREKQLPAVNLSIR
jgi:uncharacterized protein YgbK (DUF1537 family)